MDLSTRLTPPDLLAIECNGDRVSVGSSRSPRMTYLADGRLRRERTPSGTFVNSRVELNGDSLTFVSQGKAEDNVNVAFRLVDGGRRLRVTRQILAEQLTEPIVIQSIYDRIAEKVEWDIYDGKMVAKRAPVADYRPAQRAAVPRSAGDSVAAGHAAALRNALGEWLDATNRRDIDRQMQFYMSSIKGLLPDEKYRQKRRTRLKRTGCSQA